MKKRIKVVIVITVLFMVVGSVMSPKGQAEIATFYPTACLGGWVNPSNVEGEFETTSSDDEKKFTRENSSILPATTSADIYCGNFKGTIQENTKPTKIVVSLAWSVGEDIVIERNITGESFASSSQEILDTASSTDVSFTLDQATTSATSTQEEASSTENGVSSTTEIVGEIGTSTESAFETLQATNREVSTPSSLVDKVVEIVEGAVEKIFGGNNDTQQSNEEQPNISAPIREEQIQNENSEEVKPTSLLPMFLQKMTMYFIKPVLAEEVATTTEPEIPSDVDTVDTKEPEIIDITSSSSSLIMDTELVSSTTTSSSTETAENASTTEGTTTQSILGTAFDVIFDQNSEDESPNNFLEVLYTFDGVTWKTLGKVNEISMKYRTFEIPVTATTSWSDLQRLQIKVRPFQRIDATPTIYLDGIKLEVLYETPVLHPHPDFTRDIILKDKTDEGLRVINIINSDTNDNEVWYTTVETQGNYGVAPGTWVRVSLDQVGPMYKLIDMYGQNVFLVDESNKLLWVTDLQHSTNNGIGLVAGGSTTILFTKANGEEWLFEYNQITKIGVARPKI